MSFELKHKGRIYEWGSGGWFDTANFMLAPEAIRNELNAEFIRRAAKPESLAACSAETRELLFSFLRQQMGASLDKLCSCGFFEEVFRADPKAAIAYTMAARTMTPGWSMVNCQYLRDRFFNSNPAKAFDLAVKVVGGGPFDPNDLTAFLQSHNVAIAEDHEPVHAVALGRTDWDSEEIDQIIDEADGTVLRIYSQEMLISVLAGHPDPFKISPLRERLWNLYAFRSDHPGLEYVSNGWEGWVKGVASSYPISWNDSPSEFSQVERSPLVILGYRVGIHGVPEEARRDILGSAFKGPLPFVDSQRYMEGWGAACSADRLRRIAEHLVASIDSHRNLFNHHVAVSDWKADLAWLRETFYRGAYAFNWPQI